MTLRGIEPSVVRAAIERQDPLPGTTGFAGQVDDVLVRDVLGRVPLYVDASGGVDTSADIDVSDDAAEDWDREAAWAFDPNALAEPVPVPAGSVTPVQEARRTVEGGDYDTATDRYWSLPDPDPVEDESVALKTLSRGIQVTADAVPRDGVAVAFSGGVDSALVAELLDAPCYVVGFPDSHDVEAARTAAAAMDRELTVVELEPTDLERALATVAQAIGRTNAMDVSIALPLYLLAERVAADGFDRLALGQGADELFGGYEKVVRLDHRVEADTVRGAVREQIETIPDQLPRDMHAIEAAGIEPVTPLLHDAVVDAALRLPDSLLADASERKKALRAVAGDYLPERVGQREKKALQYGSLVSRELDRLARQAGYKRRMDDHVTKYVESRLEDEQ